MRPAVFLRLRLRLQNTAELPNPRFSHSPWYKDWGLCALLALLNLDPVLTYWVMFITIVPAVIGMVLVGLNYVRDLFSANRGR